MILHWGYILCGRPYKFVPNVIYNFVHNSIVLNRWITKSGSITDRRIKKQWAATETNGIRQTKALHKSWWVRKRGELQAISVSGRRNDGSLISGGGWWMGMLTELQARAAVWQHSRCEPWSPLTLWVTTDVLDITIWRLCRAIVTRPGLSDCPPSTPFPKSNCLLHS